MPLVNFNAWKFHSSCQLHDSLSRPNRIQLVVRLQVAVLLLCQTSLQPERPLSPWFRCNKVFWALLKTTGRVLLPVHGWVRHLVCRYLQLFRRGCTDYTVLGLPALKFDRRQSCEDGKRWSCLLRRCFVGLGHALTPQRMRTNILCGLARISERESWSDRGLVKV